MHSCNFLHHMIIIKTPFVALAFLIIAIPIGQHDPRHKFARVRVHVVDYPRAVVDAVQLAIKDDQFAELQPPAPVAEAGGKLRGVAVPPHLHGALVQGHLQKALDNNIRCR